MDTSGSYEITICFESPDIQNADFVFDMLATLANGFDEAGLISVLLATIHPTFEGDEIREESN
ncbi:MAG: hypothetical protein EBZ69_02110 [Alphaproteobacteria bacterium]|nr:hypothetical protein [Alphaproteobacteria bacterium]NDG19363.1 hypothetical protein [Betaproteobacteria bacterium]